MRLNYKNKDCKTVQRHYLLGSVITESIYTTKLSLSHIKIELELQDSRR
jgi:hypothetical protein